MALIKRTTIKPTDIPTALASIIGMASLEVATTSKNFVFLSTSVLIIPRKLLQLNHVAVVEEGKKKKKIVAQMPGQEKILADMLTAVLPQFFAEFLILKQLFDGMRQKTGAKRPRAYPPEFS